MQHSQQMVIPNYKVNKYLAKRLGQRTIRQVQNRGVPSASPRATYVVSKSSPFIEIIVNS